MHPQPQRQEQAEDPMRLLAHIARFGRARVVQSDPAQNQSSENEFHRESSLQISPQLPTDPDVLATEVPKQNAQKRIETAVQNQRGLKPDRRLQGSRLNALPLPDHQSGYDAERQEQNNRDVREQRKARRPGRRVEGWPHSIQRDSS